MTKKAERHLAAIDAAARLIHREGFARPDPVDLVTGAAMMADAAARLHRLALAECNTPTDEAGKRRRERAEERARGRVLDAVQIMFGPDAARLSVEWQGDCRGAPVALHLSAEMRSIPVATF